MEGGGGLLGGLKVHLITMMMMRMMKTKVHTVDSTGACNDEVISIIRYELKPFEKSWSSAKSFCSTKGGRLASILNPGDKVELLDVLKRQTRSAWIGAVSEDGEVWKWTDGTEIEEVKKLFSSS